MFITDQHNRLTQHALKDQGIEDPARYELAVDAIRSIQYILDRCPEISFVVSGGDIGNDYARDPGEVIFCYPGLRAIGNYRIAHELYVLGVPYIPRMITEMAHSETGIDIHPGAEIGHHFSIDHGTGTVIGETSVIGHHVRLFQGVSLAGEKLPPDENGNAIRGVARHPIVGDYVTVYSNSTLIGKIHIGEGATICGNVWIAEDVPAGVVVTQRSIERSEMAKIK